jgi:hypothetical protein
MTSVGLWRDDAHRYYANYPDHPKANGLAMPGVTSVISKVDKSGPLIAWAKGVTADAALDNLERVSDMAAKNGRSVAKAWLTSMATAESDRAKDLGSRVHLLAEQIERGATPDVEPIAVPYIDAYRRFRADYAPVFKSLERFVANLDRGYGGTFDWLAYLDLGRGPKLTLGDTKTGKGVYAETRLQLAALGAAEFIGLPNDPKRYPLPKIEQYALLHVRPEAYARGYQLYRVDVNQADRDAFFGALAIYRWSEQRPSKGEPVQPPALEEAAA